MNPVLIEDASIVRNGIFKESAEIYLYKKKDSSFVAVLPAEGDDPSLTYIKHANPTLIEKYILSCYGPIKWK